MDTKECTFVSIQSLKVVSYLCFVKKKIAVCYLRTLNKMVLAINISVQRIKILTFPLVMN
jgi:hypothetical protein